MGLYEIKLQSSRAGLTRYQTKETEPGEDHHES